MEMAWGDISNRVIVDENNRVILCDHCPCDSQLSCSQVREANGGTLTFDMVFEARLCGSLKRSWTLPQLNPDSCPVWGGLALEDTTLTGTGDRSTIGISYWPLICGTNSDPPADYPDPLPGAALGFNCSLQCGCGPESYDTGCGPSANLPSWQMFCDFVLFPNTGLSVANIWGWSRSEFLSVHGSDTPGPTASIASCDFGYLARPFGVWIGDNDWWNSITPYRGVGTLELIALAPVHFRYTCNLQELVDTGNFSQSTLDQAMASCGTCSDYIFQLDMYKP